jgi:hypothetical protein
MRRPKALGLAGPIEPGPIEPGPAALAAPGGLCRPSSRPDIMVNTLAGGPPRQERAIDRQFD